MTSFFKISNFDFKMEKTERKRLFFHGVGEKCSRKTLGKPELPPQESLRDSFILLLLATSFRCPISCVTGNWSNVNSLAS